MHPLDSSLDASVHGQVRRLPRRTSLDNGAICRADLLGLVSRSSWMGQWHHYSSSDDEDFHYSSSDEMEYGYAPSSRRSFHSGPRRLSLNNCTSMNTTFLASANYTVSTADKSDLDMDWHLEAAAANDDSGSSVPTLNDDDDDDDMDSFCDAEGAEPANHEYMRKDLGASCIWNDSAEEGAPPTTVRRGGKKPPRDLEGPPTKLSNNSHNTTDSQNSNPILHHQEQLHTTTSTHKAEECLEEEENLLGSEGATFIVVVNDPSSHGNLEDHHLPAAAAGEEEEEEDDDEEDCNSFCDAHDHERANRDYLKKDLGASCYWSSNEDLNFCYFTTGSEEA